MKREEKSSFAQKKSWPSHHFTAKPSSLNAIFLYYLISQHKREIMWVSGISLWDISLLKINKLLLFKFFKLLIAIFWVWLNNCCRLCGKIDELKLSIVTSIYLFHELINISPQDYATAICDCLWISNLLNRKFVLFIIFTKHQLQNAEISGGTKHFTLN
jgi:hypothetical protein